MTKASPSGKATTTVIGRFRWTWIIWFANFSKHDRDYWGGWVSLRTAWKAALPLVKNEPR